MFKECILPEDDLGTGPKDAVNNNKTILILGSGADGIKNYTYRHNRMLKPKWSHPFIPAPYSFMEGYITKHSSCKTFRNLCFRP
jgi:hypothetical protein